MATSFIRVSSEADWPDNPIKCLMWLRALSSSVCLSVEISMCVCAIVEPNGIPSLMQGLH